MIGFLGDACISANGMRSTWATGPPSQSTRTFAGKKNPRSKDLGQNPPKEEGGGDNLGMSGYESISARDRVIEKLITFRHPITEFYRRYLCIASGFCCTATFLCIKLFQCGISAQRTSVATSD